MGTVMGSKKLKAIVVRGTKPVMPANPERFARACSLTATAISLSRRAIARAHPELSPEEIDLKFVELHYGKQLAAGLRKYLRSSC